MPYEYRQSRQWWRRHSRPEMAELVGAVAGSRFAVDRLGYLKRALCDGCGAYWDDLERSGWSLFRVEDEDGVGLVMFCPTCVAAEFERDGTE